jgi:3-deoxy-7-phosphoheptulonate synthase
MGAMATRSWSPSSWRSFPVAQQPEWPNPGHVQEVVEELSSQPPLVFAGEARRLLEALGQVAGGEAFCLQAGDCAESFHERSAISIRERLKVILQMSAVLTYAASVPVVRMGRMAGQFMKPRSSPIERVGDHEIAAFRGHMVNSEEETDEARVPDPTRMLRAYNQAAATLNLLRAFTKGGFADLSQVHAWTQEFVAASPEGERYEQIAAEIDRALAFMAACGVDLHDAALHQVDVWTCHEGLLLDYEEALTRKDSLTGDWYDCSAHMLWIGERTRDPGGAHVEFFRGVNNPLGVKLGPTTTPEQALELCELLNPERVPGRLTFITRMGADQVEQTLRPLLAAVRDSSNPAVWVCDPMHANTITTDSGRKTRRFGDIMAEIEGFFGAHAAEGTWPGGVHVEITGGDVTECLGGGDRLSEEALEEAYQTLCDPRLNARQSLDLAFHLAELMRR